MRLSVTLGRQRQGRSVDSGAVRHQMQVHSALHDARALSEDGLVPESAEQSAERKRRAREAARRREAAGVLRIIAVTASYAAEQVASETEPGLARSAALEAASEMQMAAVSLRRLVRLRPAERRSLARMLTGRGMSRVQVGMVLGVSERSVRKYMNGGSGGLHSQDVEPAVEDDHEGDPAADAELADGSKPG